MQDDQILPVEDTVNDAAADTLDEVSEGEQDSSPAPQVLSKHPVETEQARNFRQLKAERERAERNTERAERERDEAIRYIREMQAKQQPAPTDDDDLSISADDFVEGKTVKKVYNEVKELKKQLKQYQQQSSASVAETRLKSIHPDADAVLSKDNIAQFSEKYPEMANTIFHSAGDDYSKMLSAYTMIKQLGVHQESAPDLYQADRQLAQRNAAKPRPLTSIAPQQGDSPMSRANAFANGLTRELREQLWKEMNEYKNRSTN